MTIEQGTKAQIAATGVFGALGSFPRAEKDGAFAAALRLVPALVSVVLLIFAFCVVPAAMASPPKTIATEGPGAGRVAAPESVAVDQSTGDIYVADFGRGITINNRIDEFDSAGNFIRAFGWGVLNGAEEFQTCTTVCEEGIGSYEGGYGPGEFFYPVGVAVDNSGGSSDGDVYVTETHGYRVQKFTAAGEFVLMFGKEVDKTKVAAHAAEAEQNVCTAVSHDTCGVGVGGTGPGELNNIGVAEPPVAVGASGEVWVGDFERFEEFSPEGVYESEVGFPGAGSVKALAIAPFSGDFYAIGDRLAGVHRFESGGAPIETLDEAGHANAVGVDPVTGSLFVSDQANPTVSLGTATLLEYDSAGAQVESFGAGQVIGKPEGDALAFGDSSQSLYVASRYGQFSGAAVQGFVLPPGGPILREGSLSAGLIKTTTSVLNGKLDSEGAATEYHFEYVTEKQFKQEPVGHGFDHATSVAVGSLPGDFAEHEVSAVLTGLKAETAYRFRIVAKNINGVGNLAGEEAGFETLPPVQIDEESVSDVTASSATFGALINPLGNASEYHFEYVTEAVYQENVSAGAAPFAGAALAPVVDGVLGAGEEDQSVSEHVQGLLPGTSYRYRVVARNAGGPAVGVVEVFATQTGGGGAVLADGRAWELVSQPNKDGALLEPIGEDWLIQAAAGGGAISYVANAPTEAEPQGNSDFVQVFSARGSQGWVSKDIALPEYSSPGASVGSGQEYQFFSEDLSLGIAQPKGLFAPPGSSQSLSAEASEQTPFLHSDFVNGSSGELCTVACYRPLVTGAPGVENVPGETHFEEGGNCPAPPHPKLECGPRFVGGTPDLGHIVLESSVALTSTPISGRDIYEWDGDKPPSEQLQLVSVLPGPGEIPARSAAFGVQNGPEGRAARRAISDDGSRIEWESASHLYTRDMKIGQTVQLDTVQAGVSAGGAVGAVAKFQIASSDGSRVLFTDEQRLTSNAGAETGEPDLYECEIVEEAGELKCRLSDLTPGSQEEHADVQGGVLGASEDGSWVYFVADGALTKSAGETHGGPFLYVRHDGVTDLITVLSVSDQRDWAEALASQTARVSPDGEWLAFMSDKSLTGYDNHDARNAQPDDEVYVYHASTGTLACASCDPTGARPNPVEGSAGSVPGWTPFKLDEALYQSRYLSDNGRLFFDSGDALVPQDVDGSEDVYEWEPEGVGSEAARCGPGSGGGGEAFKPAHQFEVEGRGGVEPAGCVSLISSGGSGEGSVFLDASATGGRDAEGHEGGGDVFFLSAARLAPQDVDTSLDVYDAHECSGMVPCAGVSVAPPECTTADACRTPPTPQPAIFGAPSSATFSGIGNFSPPAAGKVSTKKAVKCAKNKKLSHGKCVNAKRKAKSKSERGGRSGKARKSNRKKGRR